MFRIGDLVVGSFDNGYLFTNERSLSIVIDIYDEDRMRIATLEGNNLNANSTRDMRMVENIEEYLSPSSTHSEEPDINRVYIFSVEQDRFYLINSFEE